jgi:16S rRNA A1518/A1519 N6-dimethyltransferase RsmA/KsgA/DIM1 with predicted DNA glycosylase/AP lyase activity
MGSDDIVVDRRSFSQRELFELGFLQRVYPLATIRTELLVLEIGPAVAAGLLCQELSFLVGGIVPRA